MALSIQIFLVLLVLASFVIAFFSARTWHWGHVLVVLGIFLATLGFFVLAAETLRIYAVLGREVNQRQRELDSVQARNDALVRGTEDPRLIGQLRGDEVRIPDDAESLTSLADLDHRLHVATALRGRLWRNVESTGIDPQTGAVGVAVQSPVPAGIPADSVVYVFEQGAAQLPAPDGTPRGAQYLGEFVVSQAAGQQATLQPVLPLDDFEQARLAASRGPWVMYATMPADRHAIFAGMTEEELRQKLPPQSVDEYLRHGREAGPDDPDERRAGFDVAGRRLPPDRLGEAARVVYQRRLRDYPVEFDELSRRRTVMEAEIAALTTDIERLAAALTSAEELQAARENEIQRLGTDMAGVKTERQAIGRHLAQLQQQLATVRQLLEQTLRRNSELANELAARQLGPADAPLVLGVN